MHGILLQFNSSKIEETRARAIEAKNQYESVPGFRKITFFNDVEAGGNSHGYLLQVEAEEVADQIFKLVQEMDLSDLEISNLTVRKFQLFE